MFLLQWAVLQPMRQPLVELAVERGLRPVVVARINYAVSVYCLFYDIVHLARVFKLLRVFPLKQPTRLFYGKSQYCQPGGIHTLPELGFYLFPYIMPLPGCPHP